MLTPGALLLEVGEEVVERLGERGMGEDGVAQRRVGNVPSIAISIIAISSPPSMPRIAQPRICPLSASTTAFMKPRVSSTSAARAT